MSVEVSKTKLLAAAREAAMASYSPFSRFRVGAAVLDERGRIFSGTNIENASYSLTICAERVAIFSAISGGAKRIVAIAVCCPDAPSDAGPGFSMPCGACRQVIAEFGDSSLPVHVDGRGDFQLKDLLPNPFRFEN